MTAKPKFNPETGEVLEDGDEVQEVATKLFAAFIQEQREGLLHRELSEVLADLGQACIDLQKDGSVTLTLKVKPAGKEQNAVFITDSVKVKMPEDRPPAMFFADSHGNLSRRDPRQQALDLKDVSKPKLKDLPKG